jgi:hypothetical protein
MRTRSNLKTPSNTCSRDAAGRGPAAVGKTCDDESGAGFPRKDEAGFNDGEDCKAYSLSVPHHPT